MEMPNTMTTQVRCAVSNLIVTELSCLASLRWDTDTHTGKKGCI